MVLSCAEIPARSSSQCGLTTERFRKVTLTASDLQQLQIQKPRFTCDGDGQVLRIGVQAYSLGIAYEFDPYFGLSISRVDPLPHQLEAVHDYLLKLARVRFLFADDAGAGKTIMAGLLIRELKLPGLAERVLVICPANLIPNCSRIRSPFNQWLETPMVITSLDLAKRENILPGLKQVRWDLVIVDEAHRMSWTPPSTWLQENALLPFLEDVRKERIAEVERIAAHIEMSLAELLAKEDAAIGRSEGEAERGVEGAAGNLKQAEDRHSVLLQRREARRQEMDRQRSLTLQAVD